MIESFYEVIVDAAVDTHVHLREEDQKVMAPLLERIACGGADYISAIPNTQEGLTTAKQVLDYTTFAKDLMPQKAPLGMIPMVLVTPQTTKRMIDECVDLGIVDCKFLPLDRTTGSENGIRHYGRLLPIVKHCGKRGMKCHMHPEHPNLIFDNRNAEFAFVSIVDMFLNETEATMIWEHGTDAAQCLLHWIDFAQSGRFYLTLTPQAFLTDENDAFGDVLKTFKSPPKTNLDRYLLADLVAKNFNWVMAGSDFAPHRLRAKHPPKGKCACGAYHGKYTLPLYAHALDHLLMQGFAGMNTFVNFTSRHARTVHHLPPPSFPVTLVRKPQVIPLSDEVGPLEIGHFYAGQEILWSIKK